MIELSSTPGPVFWILAAVTIVSGLMVVSLRNIFHCALCLIVCLSGVAGIFILLGAEFLAAAQILIYVGAVSILMIFAIMLTSRLGTQTISQTNENVAVAFLTCLVFFCMSVFLTYRTSVWMPAEEALPEKNTFEIGRLLMSSFMVPFEVVSVLLVAALVGAIVLAREERS
jgi:NADH:ubiquinone oxidoreductase subunit 6 (subunit J)